MIRLFAAYIFMVVMCSGRPGTGAAANLANKSEHVENVESGENVERVEKVKSVNKPIGGSAYKITMNLEKVKNVKSVESVENVTSIDLRLDGLQKGKSLIQKGQYQQAVLVLESTLQHGVQTADLYYNLGNACFKSDRIGKAILYYERGLMSAPFNAVLIHNRDFALKQALLEPRPAAAIWERLLLRKTADRILFISLFPLLICSVTYVLRSAGFIGPFSRPALRIFNYSFGACMLMVLGMFGYLWIGQSADYGVVMHKSAARSGPAAQAKVAFDLREGERVEMLRSYGTWNKIKNASGQSGWVANVAVETF